MYLCRLGANDFRNIAEDEDLAENAINSIVPGTTVQELETMKEALNGEYAETWKEATNSEYESLLENDMEPCSIT